MAASEYFFPFPMSSLEKDVFVSVEKKKKKKKIEKLLFGTVGEVLENVCVIKVRSCCKNHA